LPPQQSTEVLENKLSKTIDPTIYRLFKTKNTKMSVFPQTGLYKLDPENTTYIAQF